MLYLVHCLIATQLEFSFSYSQITQNLPTYWWRNTLNNVDKSNKKVKQISPPKGVKQERSSPTRLLLTWKRSLSELYSDVWAPSSETEETHFSHLWLRPSSFSHHHLLMTTGQGPNLNLTVTIWGPSDIFMHVWERSHLPGRVFLIFHMPRWGALWLVTSGWRECINNWIFFIVIVTHPRVCVCCNRQKLGRGGGAQDKRAGCDIGVVLVGFDVSSSDFPTLSMNICASQASFFLSFPSFL